MVRVWQTRESRFYLIELLHMKALTKLLAKMPAGAPGIEGETN